jgi:hypothetical protein
MKKASSPRRKKTSQEKYNKSWLDTVKLEDLSILASGDGPAYITHNWTNYLDCGNGTYMIQGSNCPVWLHCPDNSHLVYNSMIPGCFCKSGHYEGFMVAGISNSNCGGAAWMFCGDNSDDFSASEYCTYSFPYDMDFRASPGYCLGLPYLSCT